MLGGEEPRSSFPSEIKQVCLPPSRSLSLGQEEPTYLGGGGEKAGGRDRVQMFKMKI